MKEKIWVTKDGKEIKYKDLEDSHLLNIISFVKKQSENGVETKQRVYVDNGYDGDSYVSDFHYIYSKTKGKKVLELFGYNDLLKEAQQRNLKQHEHGVNGDVMVKAIQQNIGLGVVSGNSLKGIKSLLD